VRLPNGEQAIIDAAKLRDYLLSFEHPIGRFKARFFRRLGFERDEWQRLAKALREQHLPQDAVLAEITEHGQLFTIRAILRGQSGKAAVVSVWLIRNGEAHARFVTAYPGGTK
jgi:hypothetical protein